MILGKTRQVRCYNKCEKCGINGYWGYLSSMGLTAKQIEDFSKKRATCGICGGPAKILNLEEERKYGLDGAPGYQETPKHLIKFMQTPQGRR